MPDTMSNILRKLRSKTYPSSRGGRYQQINDEPIENHLDFADEQPSENQADERQPLVSQNNSYASLTDHLEAAKKAIEKKQNVLTRFMSDTPKVFTQINTELDDNNVARLYDILGKKSLFNVIETALAFKYNYESWLKTFCTVAVFTAILHATQTITLHATQKEKDVKPNEFNDAMNEVIAATIDQVGKTLESWGLNNDDINMVKQHLSGFQSEGSKKTWLPQPPIAIVDLDVTIEKLNDKLNESEFTCIKSEKLQAQFNRRYSNLNPQKNLTATLQESKIADSLSTKQPIGENGNDKISSLDDVLANLIQQYIMAREGESALQKLGVITHLLRLGATLTEDFALNSTLHPAKAWALLGTLLRNKIDTSSKKSGPLEQLLTFCDNKFKSTAHPQSTDHTSRPWSIFKPKQKNNDINVRKNLPSKIAELIKSVYTGKLNEKIIQEIYEITTPHNKKNRMQRRETSRKAVTL
mgnify:CR=1 FL=1